jgi:uncharacterized protein GlcG (DUF336 family)
MTDWANLPPLEPGRAVFMASADSSLHSVPLEHSDDAKKIDPLLTVLATSPEGWQEFVREQTEIDPQWNLRHEFTVADRAMFASSFPYAATRISNEGDFDKRSSVTGGMASAAYCSRPLGSACGLLLSGGVLARPVCDRAKTLAIAKRIGAAASKGACQFPTNAPECLGSLAVVNDPGDLIDLETFDGTQGPSVDRAIKKAKAAALNHRPTSMFREAVTKGTSMS